MLIETVAGRNYTAAEIQGWLTDIGYRDIAVVRFEAAGANGVVMGYKPSDV
jgi:3-hydroxy-5-methyl-1-naphthoate 3-O-methyltransferase